jgi:hypothetical protein
MSTLGGMVAEIGADLRRPTYTTNIKLAIAAAAAFFRSRRTQFNYKTFTFNTAILQEYYDATDSANIPLIAKEDAVTYVDGTMEYELKKVTSDWIDTHQLQAGYSALPEKWAFVDGEIRLYPVPNAARVVRFDGIIEVIDANQSLANQRLLKTNVLALPDGYASDWFTDGNGYEAIKYWAKGHMLTNLLRNPTEGQSMFTLAEGMINTATGQAQSSDGSGDEVQCEDF